MPTEPGPARWWSTKAGQAFAADVTAFFHHQLDIATPMWNSPVVEFAHDQIGKAADAIMDKTATPKDALAAAQQASQAELERVLKRQICRRVTPGVR